MRLFSFFLLGCLWILSCKKNDTTIDTSTADTSHLRLINSWFIPANFEKNGMDTFYLHFNRKVNVGNIHFKSDFCTPDLLHSSADNGTTVKIYNILCRGLGDDFPFEFTVTDTAGATLVDSVNFQTYTRNVALTGSPTNYFITDDNNFCWVTTTQPNQVICFGITDPGYRKTFDLSFTPAKAVFNLYNNKIYLIPAIDDFAHRDSIYIMNPSNGLVEKRIAVPREDYFNFEQFPEDIAIGTNGYGMVKITNENYSSSWLVIDCAANDTLYRHPDVVALLNLNLIDFTTCFTNYDKTRILALEVSGRCRIGVLDCATHALSEESFPVSQMCVSNFFVPNKIKNDLFIVNLQSEPYSQFIVSNGNMTGTSTSFDSYGNAEAEFSYRAGETNYMYYLDNNVIGIVDYNNGNILMSTSFSIYLNSIHGTTNGKYLLAKGSNCIKIFDTGILYSNL